MTRTVVLDLLWGDMDAEHVAMLAGWTDADWSRLDRTCGQHRLRPLLHDRLHSAPWCVSVPAAMRARWVAAHRRAGLRAIRQRAVAMRIGRLFAAAGLCGVVLKGGSLVWRGWIDPALRPMRDLDIVVAAVHAADAHALLRRSGFSGPAAALAAGTKHLPGLTDAATGVHVELHVRLFETLGADMAAREKTLREALTAGAEPFATGLTLLTPTATLLHLILHAVLDHQFNNGPLLLLDIQLLVARGEVDWPWFWRMAELAQATRACQLALVLARDRAGVREIAWCGHAPADLDPRVAGFAAAMMLIDTSRMTPLGWIGRLLGPAEGGASARLAAMLARAWRAWRGGCARTEATSRIGFGIGKRALTAYAGVLLRAEDRRHLLETVTVARWLRRG